MRYIKNIKTHLKKVNKFREEQKLLFNLSIIGILFNLSYGLTLKIPTLFGDADTVNYFYNNFLGNLFWGITLSTVFYYINIWSPEKKKLEKLHVGINQNRNACIEAFNTVLNMLTRNGKDWDYDDLLEIVKLIDSGILLTNEQINIIANKFCKNDPHIIDNLRFGGIYSRLNVLVDNLDKLIIIYGDYLYPEEKVLIADLKSSLFLRDIVINNNGNEMYKFYCNIYKLKSYVFKDY